MSDQPLSELEQDRRSLVERLAVEIIELHGKGATAEQIGDYVWESDRSQDDHDALVEKIWVAFRRGLSPGRPVRGTALSDEQLDQIRKQPIDHTPAGIWTTALDREALLDEIKRLKAELPKCNGLCLRASDSDVLEDLSRVVGNPVARPHRSCPLHGDLEQVAWELTEALKTADVLNERQAALLDRVEVRLTGWRHSRSRREAAAEMQAELDREVTS